jgi:hypothetical protein
VLKCIRFQTPRRRLLSSYTSNLSAEAILNYRGLTVITIREEEEEEEGAESNSTLVNFKKSFSVYKASILLDSRDYF